MTAVNCEIEILIQTSLTNSLTIVVADKRMLISYNTQFKVKKNKGKRSFFLSINAHLGGDVLGVGLGEPVGVLLFEVSFICLFSNLVTPPREESLQNKSKHKPGMDPSRDESQPKGLG